MRAPTTLLLAIAIAAVAGPMPDADARRMAPKPKKIGRAHV